MGRRRLAPGQASKSLILSGFWRRRASSSATTILFGVARAILPVRALKVKSFLRKFIKIF
jgi:hypothetical protein